MAETLVPNCNQRIQPSLARSASLPARNNRFRFPSTPKSSCRLSLRLPWRKCKPAAALSASSSVTEQEKDAESMNIDNLRQFIKLNLGKWNGSFYQFDAHGNLLQNVSTRLSASSYGEDELISLIQTLYIKQPPSRTSIEGQDSAPEWAEYKIKAANMFTVDKYQQSSDWFFPERKSFFSKISDCWNVGKCTSSWCAWRR